MSQNNSKIAKHHQLLRVYITDYNSTSGINNLT